MNPWLPLAGLVVVAGFVALRAEKAGAVRKIRRAAKKAGAVFPVKGGKLSTKARHAYHYQRTATHRHQGVDIFRPVGTPVLAPVDGTVVHVNRKWASGFSGYGRTVVLRVELVAGDPLWLLFAHLDSVDVDKGDKVLPGDQLGTVGLSEFTRADHTAFMPSGAHLHFELATRPYPMAPDAPFRVDPTPLLQGL